MEKATQPANLAALQGALGPPLRSEQRATDLLPRTLSRTDMLVIFIMTVLFLPNPAIIEASQNVGIAAYIYWMVGAVSFLLPGMLVAAQLHRLIPADGGIYTWSQRALGPLWGFLAGFCAWLPGILILLATSDAIITFIQAIWFLALGSSPAWLASPWQQGLFIIGILLLVHICAEQPLRILVRVAKYIALLYALAIAIVGAAGAVWLIEGHSFQTPFSTIQSGLGTHNFPMFSIVVLAFLGVEVPFTMAAEAKQTNAPRLFLRWGALLVLLVYAVSTFGIISVIPSTQFRFYDAPLIAVQQALGLPWMLIVGCLSILFFLAVTLFYNLTFARILFVAGLDFRLPSRLAMVNKRGAPVVALRTQTALAIVLVLLTYMLGPLLHPGLGNGFPLTIYNISVATINIIWCISMIFFFLALPILLKHLRERITNEHELLIAPRWLLYGSCILGELVCVLSIVITLSASWENTTFSNHNWALLIGSTVVCLLVLGLIGAAYPRIMSSLEEQTAIAKENGRLYGELKLAYARQSELDRLKDTFLATTSHELRTPLTIMQGYLELLGEMKNLEPEVQRAFVTKARRACEELVLLQENIVDASRLKYDVGVIHATSIPLKLLCREVVELFEPLVVQQKRDVILNIHPQLKVWADETRLKQILRNLISNAINYSEANTTIWIKAMHDPRLPHVWVSVVDQGLGIPEDQRAEIFERFTRLERDMNSSTRGSGLGLAITKQLVEAMGGMIYVESSGSAGEGSTFTFSLAEHHNDLESAQKIFLESRQKPNSKSE
ncbi:MAG TPA: amino acid permease [Ktedonobacteraceae bacterium]|nr:amino acid permease [Ktedonobacteraceae bacterium]